MTISGGVRRWHTAGAIAGLLAGVVAGLPEQRFTLALFPLLAGWFAGAVIAEFRFRPMPAAPVVAGRNALQRVPHALAATTVGVTAIVLFLGRERAGLVLAWGAAALVVAAAVATTNRHGNSRTVVGIGTALVLACLAHQLAAVQDRYFDTMATAIGAIVLLWTFGGLALAVTLWRSVSVRPALLLAGAIAATSAGAAGYAWWHDRPPFPASAVQATATLRFTDEQHFAADARALGVTGLETLVTGQQFLGRVDYTGPASAEGTYQVLVIDKQQNRVAGYLSTVDGGGWSSQLETLAARYPWLSATAPRVTEAGSAVSRDAGEPGPLTFAGTFAGDTLVADPLVVLVLSGPEGQIYWAKRVSG